MKKRGTILIENIIFIILNLLFLSVLALFLIKQGSGVVMLEESYAKQIALLVNAAEPGMTLKINMDKAKKISDKNGIDFKEVLEINENTVVIKLSQESGYSYAFFNNVDVGKPYPDGEFYIMVVDKK